MTTKIRLSLFLVLIAFLGGCKNSATPEPQPGVSTLPLNQITLSDLSAFSPTTSNWQITGTVVSDYQKDQDLSLLDGSGVLVNKQTDGSNDNIFTIWEHGDLELDLEFMMPRSSNSGIYLQGRYEIQLLDSWMIENPSHSDCGGIYQRWNDEADEGSEGYEGHAPAINACKAPGLWQHLYVKFTAPVFDSLGNKLSDARFDKVLLNGMLIHENVSLSGPTRASVSGNEVARAPLMIQGDHGNVAFRNIFYKRFFSEQVALSELEYKYYQTEMIQSLPHYDTLEVFEQGSVDSFSIDKIAKREDYFGIVFTGTITTPIEGGYIFHTVSDDGSKLFIDGKMVVSNDFNHGMERQSGMIELTKGVHDLRVDYFNNQWGRGLAVLYEGPEISYQPLNSIYTEKSKRSMDTLKLIPGAMPELIRCFVNYKDTKRTHAISVGSEKGIHFSVDMRNGALLKSWRGEFADVSNMWRNRGEAQLVIPLAVAIDLPDGSIAAILPNAEAPYPNDSPGELKPLGYALDKHGNPRFEYKVEDAKISDLYQVSKDLEKLERTIVIEPNGVENLYTRIAVTDYIELLDNGLYNIGGEFYLELLTPDPTPIIRKVDGNDEMLFPISEASTIKYSLLW